MLNTSRLIVAFESLDTTSDGYIRKVWDLQKEWSEWLANEYASDLPVDSHYHIYRKAWGEISSIAKATGENQLFPDGVPTGYIQLEGYYKKHAALKRAELSAQ